MSGRIEELEGAIEDAVNDLLAIVPVSGSWSTGYFPIESDQTTLVATPDEWLAAATAVCNLHYLLLRGRPSS